MQVNAFPTGAFQVNVWLVTDPETGLSALVDTGESPEIVSVLARRSPPPRIAMILLTHAHVDHAGALAEIQKTWDVPTMLPALEREMFASLPTQGLWFNAPELNRPCGRIDRWLDDGDTVELGKTTLKFLSTPGHTPGHGCFHDDDDLISGDLLFAGSIGRTDFPGSDPQAMAHSLMKVMELPKKIRVHSGHGPDSTLEAELAHNPFLAHVRRAKGMPEPRRSLWY